jgi:hypothetical protein
VGSIDSFRDIAHPIWAICSIALAISSDIHAKYKCQCFPQFKNVSAGVGQRGSLKPLPLFYRAGASLLGS